MDQNKRENEVLAIDLLCKVVDNYGDAGTVWRLAKAILAECPGLIITIITDLPELFYSLDQQLNTSQARSQAQIHYQWGQSEGTVILIPWDHPWEATKRRPPNYIIENFACGFPGGYDTFISRTMGTTIRVAALDYFTAEPWTKDYHLLPMPSPWGLGYRTLFMPGLVEGAGGVIFDSNFLSLTQKQTRRARGNVYQEEYPHQRKVLVFTYEHNFTTLLAGLSTKNNEPTEILLAPGRSAGPFLEAWQNRTQNNTNLTLRELPFLPQDQWDEILCTSDILFIRGEESLIRALLVGRPFFWHAYLQDKQHHIVKVEALLNVMDPILSKFNQDGHWDYWKKTMILFNSRDFDDCNAGLGIDWSRIWESSEVLAPGFYEVALYVKSFGDLTKKLMTFFGIYDRVPAHIQESRIPNDNTK